jgi:hypothetical protein
MKNFSAQIKASIIILFTVIISVSAFLHLKKNNFNCLSWDTYGYYLYLPSTFIYDDPGVENLKKYEELNSKYNSTATFYQFSPGKDGKNVIKYSSGLSFVFLPFFTVAHFSMVWVRAGRFLSTLSMGYIHFILVDLITGHISYLENALTFF